MTERASLGEVLIVEDTPASLKLLADLLGQAGYAVRTAPDGELALWSALARAPELILLDVRMPGMDGFEVCRQLKAAPTLCDIPVIFLSAQFATEDKVRGFRAGAIDFIGKPYQSEEVLARTAAHITLARSQRALAAANAELRSAREDLRNAERLAALGAMVAGVAHELNTPIGNCVLGASSLEQRVRQFAETAAANGLRRSDLDSFVADVTLASELLLRNLATSARLIDSFKQVATGQDGAVRRPFELAELLGQIVQGHATRLRGARVALSISGAEGIGMESYPGALEHTIGELLHNALLHAFAHGGGGTVRIEAGAAHGQLTVSVADNGSGIAPASLARVFEPFFTTRMGQGNTGLGLHIVHNLVTNVLGGTIEAHSGGGETRFVLRCPCTAPDLAARAPQP